MNLGPRIRPNGVRTGEILSLEFGC
uniref:Uncharacterized protein n=1 Tax=Arundo donax TaxID=35708 RepID=A0A0A9A994_ARUDO